MQRGTCIFLLIVATALILMTVTAVDCTTALMDLTKNQALIAGMIMNTGKYMNDLGDYEGCENISGLHYATIQIKGDRKLII